MSNKKTFQYKKSFPVKRLNLKFNLIGEKIRGLKLPSGFLQFILYSISELFSNIEEHSRAKTAFLQIKIAKNNCLIEVKDDGIGLRESYFSQKIVPKDDSSAIEFALAGLSAKNSEERGYGLYSIKKLIEKLNGKLEITTGEIRAIVEKNKTQFKKNPKSKGVSVILKTKIKKINFYKIIK